MMRRFLVLVLGGAALGGALAMACSSSSEEAAPSRPPVPPVVVAEPDAAVEEGGAPDAGCTGKDGCFTCEPAKLEEFLNACTDGQCTPFDNAARLPLFKAGQPLPPVP